MTACLAVGCGGRHSAAGFRLPENGSVDRGKQAFLDLECHSCHTVDRVELPDATPQLTLAVPLGGAVPEYRTDGYLVTSIIHPSHRIMKPRRDEYSVGGESRMEDRTQTMTVRQLVDLVAFLQSRYRFEPEHNIYY